MRSSYNFRFQISGFRTLIPLILILHTISAQEFPELVPFNKNGKWGYTDANRKMFLDPVFDEAGLFTDGVAKVVLNGKTSWIDLKGLPASPPGVKDPKKKKKYSVFMKNEKFGVADGMKQVIIKPEYDSIGHGIVDADGEPEYAKMIFIVKTKKGYGIINKEGEELIPIGLEKCRPFKLEYCLARKKEKWGVYNMKGKEVLGFKYDNITYGGDGVFLCETWITKDSSAYQYINKDGKTIGEKNYREATDFWYGMAAVKKDTAWGYINLEGKDAAEYKFDLAEPFYLDSGKYALVKLKDKYGIIDKDGQYTVFPDYEKCLGYSDGLFRMSKGGKIGFINTSGSVIIPFDYEDATAPREGYIAVKQNGKWGVIDVNGAAVLALIYEGEMGCAGLSLFWVKDLNGDLKGYVNIYGTEYWGEK